MGDRVTDEELWSWIDRNDPALTAYLSSNPQDRQRVESIRATIDGVRTAATPPPLPERIGRYTVRRLVGTGSMGAVYEAEQENPRRTVALKVVHTGLQANPQILKYFRRD